VRLGANCRRRTTSLGQCISGSLAKNDSTKSDSLVSVADQTEDATYKLLKWFQAYDKKQTTEAESFFLLYSTV